MSTARCCSAARGAVHQAHARPHSAVQRCLGVAQWAAPAAALGMLPKCPMCLAAYVAVATGIGLSVTAATYLRAGLAAVCVATLVFLAARWAYRVRSQ